MPDPLTLQTVRAGLLAEASDTRYHATMSRSMALDNIAQEQEQRARVIEIAAQAVALVASVEHEECSRPDDCDTRRPQSQCFVCRVKQFIERASVGGET